MTAPCLPTKIRCKDCRFSSCIPKYHLVGGLEHFFLFHKNWEYSSQLTFTPSFFRGVGQPPSSHYIPFFHQALRSCVPIPRWGWVVSTTIHNVHMLVIWVSAVSHCPWKKYPSYIPIIWTVTLWYIISSTLAVIGLGRLVSIIFFCGFQGRTVNLPGGNCSLYHLHVLSNVPRVLAAYGLNQLPMFISTWITLTQFEHLSIGHT